ncbi:transcriptional regulator Myc-A [Tetranychus urticae]|uniref:BHLH domain-containing protein n=1 Tax=Tetranychus urticae TaxID=32264 RepID=T1K160_TETUR|nr:transcriptional regulator Myc-A [Tetranychus urticae]
MDYDPFGYVSQYDNMDYKCLVHDCMWSGTCKEDNLHESTNKLSDFSYFSTSPVYGSIFDIFNIDDENSLGEIDGDNEEYDEEEDSPLSGLSGDSGDEHKVVNNSHIKDHSYGNNKSSMCIAGNKATCSTSTSTSSSLMETNIISSSDTNSSCSSSSLESTTLLQSSSNQLVPCSQLSEVELTSIPATATVTSSIISPTTSATPTVAIKTIGKSRNPKSSCQERRKELNAAISTITQASSTHVPANTSILKSTGKPRNPKSLYPERRKEHNNSEKKRRDHLRNAFNHLRDQIPKLKDGEKKAARVTILKEASSYVTLLKEKHRYLERTKTAETIKKENLLKRLKLLQSGSIDPSPQQQQIIQLI